MYMSHEAAHCEIKPSNIEASQVLDVAFCCDSCNMLNLDDNSLTSGAYPSWVSWTFINILNISVSLALYSLSKVCMDYLLLLLAGNFSRQLLMLKSQQHQHYGKRIMLVIFCSNVLSVFNLEGIFELLSIWFTITYSGVWFLKVTYFMNISEFDGGSILNSSIISAFLGQVLHFEVEHAKQVYGFSSISQTSSYVYIYIWRMQAIVSVWQETTIFDQIFQGVVLKILVELGIIRSHHSWLDSIVRKLVSSSQEIFQ